MHFRDGVRVHGFITDGGQAVNIIPERAACEFSVRAKSLPRARAFAGHMAAMGRPAAETDERVGMGSTDMGDVSHAVPAIHPWLAICDAGETLCRQHAFARAACAERGLETMLTAARAMAKTGAEFLVDGALRSAVRAAFEGR